MLIIMNKLIFTTDVMVVLYLNGCEKNFPLCQSKNLKFR